MSRPGAAHATMPSSSGIGVPLGGLGDDAGEHQEGASLFAGETTDSSGLASLDIFASAAALAATSSLPRPSDADPSHHDMPDDTNIGSPLFKDCTLSGAEDGGTRRRTHNVCERKRRQHIRQAFVGLKSRLPQASEPKMSKMEILRSAIDHIKKLRTTLTSMEQELKAYRSITDLQLE